MIGLLFLATVAAWFWASFWLSMKVGRRISKPILSSTARILILVVSLCLPFADEVIGKYQFEALCKANGIESADVSKARGKRVKLEYMELGSLGGTVMPIKVDDIVLKAAGSGEVLTQYKDYYAFGGWLMRYTPLSMGSQHPMLFSGNGCGLALKRGIFEVNRISQVN